MIDGAFITDKIKSFAAEAGEINAVYHDKGDKTVFRSKVIGWAVVRKEWFSVPLYKPEYRHLDKEATEGYDQVVPCTWLEADNEMDIDAIDSGNFLGLEFGGKQKDWVKEIGEYKQRHEKRKQRAMKLKQQREQEKFDKGVRRVKRLVQDTVLSQKEAWEQVQKDFIAGKFPYEKVKKAAVE